VNWIRKIYSFDYMGHKFWWFTISGIIIGAGLVSLFVRGGGDPLKGLNYGLEFKEGTRLSVALVKPATVADVRATIDGLGYGPSQVQQVSQVGSSKTPGFQIQVETLAPADQAKLKAALDKAGLKYISADAAGSAEKQAADVESLITKGAKALIILAWDQDAILPSVQKAKQRGIPVIAYDRLIKTPKIDAYISFDNVEVGRQQAMGVMTALGLPGSTTWTKDNPAKVVQLAGSPTDNNATLFTKGQTEVLQPYIDSGVIKIVAQQGVDNWNAANALKLMENILTAAQDGTVGDLLASQGESLAVDQPILSFA